MLFRSEKALPPSHPDLVANLRDYAALLRKMNRVAEATAIETRVKGIELKRAQEKVS